MNPGDLVWWDHFGQPRWGTLVETDGKTFGVLAGDELLYVDQINTPSELPDGAYEHKFMPEHVYHKMPHLSRSAAQLLLPPSVPAKFRYRMDAGEVYTPAFDTGKLVHRLVLGAGPEIAVMDPAIHGIKKDGTLADNPKATSAWKAAEVEARQRNAVPVHVSDYQVAQQMADAVRTHPLAGPLFESGDPEMSLFVHDPETDVGLRARPDCMALRDDRAWIVELKTAIDGNPDTWGRTSFKWSYHLQMSWYVEVCKMLGLDDAPAFAFVIVEKNPPYLVSVCELDTEAYQFGKEQMREAIHAYVKWSKADEWPGYPPEIHSVSLPAWALPEDEMVI